MKERHRKCSTCGKRKSIREYQKDKNSGKNGYRRICKSCSQAHQKLIRELTRYYGPKPKRCEITGRKGKIVLDHCHRTGDFRGWILDSFNKGIGLLGDEPLGLFQALKYLMNPTDKKRLLNAFNTIEDYIHNEKRK